MFGLNLDTLKAYRDGIFFPGILSTRSTYLDYQVHQILSFERNLHDVDVTGALFGLNLDTLKAYRDGIFFPGILATRSTYLDYQVHQILSF